MEIPYQAKRGRDEWGNMKSIDISTRIRIYVSAWYFIISQNLAIFQTTFDLFAQFMQLKDNKFQKRQFNDVNKQSM